MAENTENEPSQFGDDGWGLRAYAAAQGKVYAEAMAEALSWLRPLIVFVLAAFATTFAVFAYLSSPNSFQQNLWIELAGGIAIISGASVFLCFGMRFHTYFRLFAFAVAIALSVIAYHSTGVTQQLLLELGVGLIVLICIELWIEHLIERLNAKITDYENRATEAEDELEELNPQKLGGL